MKRIKVKKEEQTVVAESILLTCVLLVPRALATLLIAATMGRMIAPMGVDPSFDE